MLQPTSHSELTRVGLPMMGHASKSGPGKRSTLRQVLDYFHVPRQGADVQNVYVPLEHEDTFRLLVLEPAPAPSATLRCRLIHVRLATHPAYEAVSYTWGKAVFPKILYLRNGQLKITRNLSSALSRFRFQDKKTLLWIDAVCINQRDNAERGRQVGMMPEIFRSASMVLIWLGVGNSETGRALQHYKQLAVLAPRLGITEALLEDCNAWPGSLHGEDAGMSRVLTEAKDNQLDVIPSLPWFTRLWVLQELVVARKATLYCGMDELDWTSFAMATLLLYQAISTSRTITLNIPIFTLSSVLVRAKATALVTSGGLISAVRRSRDKLCLDDRDRIYAVLGLQALGCQWSQATIGLLRRSIQNGQGKLSS